MDRGLQWVSVVRHLAPLLCALSLVLLGCPGTLEDPERFTGNHDAGTDAGTAGYVCPSAGVKVKTQLINARCGTAGCHDTGTQSGGLDLASAGAPARLVNIPAAQCTGQTLATADGGYLISKLHPSPPCGSQMPIGPPLTDQEIQCITEWVANISNGGQE